MSNMVNKFQSITIATCIAALVLLGAIAPATAEAPPELDTQKSREFWTKYGVSEDTQDLLEEKMRSGFPTDATRGNDPVSSHPWTTDGENSIVTVYADGSISVSGSERAESIPPGVINPAAAITACTINRGSGWATFRNCTIFNQTDTVYIAIKANYNTYVGKPGEITSSWAHKFQSYGGTQIVDPLVRKRYQKTATGTSDAIALWGGSIKSYNNRYSETVNISLRVTVNGVARAGVY